jgi:hypothetical protein
MKAVKKMIEVEKDKSVTIKPLPFKPGSKVEVIVLPVKEEKDIFTYMDKVVKKKKIIPLSLKDVEKIVHEVRSGK